jgi:hypothetical protein
VFTVKTGFGFPGAGSGSVASAERGRGSRGIAPRPDIITAESLEEARMARTANRPRVSAILRESRTLPHHLLGRAGDLGDTEGRSHTGLLVTLLAAGAVGAIVILLGTALLCRSGGAGGGEEATEEEEGEGRDRQQLQPGPKGPGRRESRA